ncbi:MAG: glutathione peroxidase [Bacteroidetes bacterium]|nr:MAG: glutathione peroxidase [Bacteroidota bacterium]
MKNIGLILIAFLLVECTAQSKSSTTEIATEAVSKTTKATSFYDFSIPSLMDDNSLNMADYKGKKILVVNVASKCGYTPQYEGLQELHTKYGDQVQIIGFPCNQFMGQEPGGKEEIAQFCSKNYGVTFPLTTKISVKGDSQNEIYKWLTSKDLNGKDDYKVSWNFNKFLIDESGKLINHYGSKVTPMSDELIAAITK